MSEQVENPVVVVIPSSHFYIEQDKLIENIFGRRFTDYYSWMMTEVDKIGGLLTLGRMAIIGGPHGTGKTTFITEMAKYNAASKPTMIIPLEMGADFTVMMLACNLFNSKRTSCMDMLGYGEIEEGYLYQRPAEDLALFKECISELYEQYPNLYINTPGDYGLESLIELIKAYYVEFGIKFFIVDHLHQLDSSQSSEGETAFYSHVAKSLKNLASELNIALLCVVQLTKSANGKDGQLDLSAFKGTSEFTSNAHRVVMIKKVNYTPPAKAEAKRLMGESVVTEGLTIEEYLEQHAMDFASRTSHIRELVFLKTRGRPGGAVSIEMNRGEFEFLHGGRHIYSLKK
jgi:replicative DNA helicase